MLESDSEPNLDPDTEPNRDRDCYRDSYPDSEPDSELNFDDDVSESIELKMQVHTIKKIQTLILNPILNMSLIHIVLETKQL